MPVNAGRVDAIKVKINRGRKHIADASDFIDLYLSRNPFSVSTRRDPQTHRLIYFVNNVDQPDPQLAGIVGDALHNLRSSLDHIAYRLVENGTGMPPSRHIYFPIFDDRTNYNSHGHRQVRGASPNAVQAIDAIRPYREGNSRLWQLHKLNIVDKHRLLLMGGAVFDSVNISPTIQQAMHQAFSHNADLQARFSAMPMPDLFLRPADNLFPLMAGAELYIDAPDAEPHPHTTFRFTVSAGNAEILHGEPILQALTEMANEVDAVLNQLASHL